MTHMRILIITHSYPPAKNPRAFRWGTITDKLVKSGHVVDVVTSVSGAVSDDLTREGLSVYRCGISIRDAILKKATIQNNGKGAIPSSKGILKRIYDLTWKRVCWPDYAGPWVLPAYLKVKSLLKNNKYDGIISVSLPFSGHLVGLLGKLSSPGIPWLADSGDPFCFFDAYPLNNHFLYSRLNYAVERRVFNAATVLTVTTEGTKRKYAEIFPGSLDKITVIPPLLSETPYDHGSDLFSGSEAIRWVFVGTLYKKIRNPEFLLSIFSALSRLPGRKLELHFLGPINDCQDCFSPYTGIIGKQIFLHGLLDKSAAATAMRQADYLVNIGNSTPYQLPSKVVEYVWAEKPVLNFVDIPDDSSAEFFAPHPAVITLLRDKGTLEQHSRAVEEFMSKSAEGFDKAGLQSWLSDFSAEKISAEYISNLANPSRRVDVEF